MAKELKVNGLANIGRLLNRADLPTAPAPTPKRERRTRDEIAARTIEKVVAAVGLSSDKPLTSAAESQVRLISTFVQAAVRDAYNGGHADALDQNSAVEKLLEQQYEARTKMTLPAAVAAIMEQRGLASMTLDLAMLATVFDRQTIDFDVQEGDIINYRLTPRDEA
jgi:dsRNA-specific ribonuclease